MSHGSPCNIILSKGKTVWYVKQWNGLVGLANIYHLLSLYKDNEELLFFGLTASAAQQHE